MALHYLFIVLFLIPIGVGTGRYFLDPGAELVFHDMMQATFDWGVKGVDLILFFMLPMTILWMGLLNIAEKSGAIKVVSWFINPFFSKLFPEVPKDHPARGSIIMNYAANMLGLDNAATPIGLRAIGQLQELNPNKKVASNAQIMFLVLNTSGLSIIPVGVFTLRAQAESGDITGVFVPVLIATYFASLVALITVSIIQKINLFDRTVLAYILGTLAVVLFVMWYFSGLESGDAKRIAAIIGDSLYMGFIALFLLFGAVKRINLFDSFIDGAKDAFNVCVKILPYLIGFMVAAGVLISSGTMDMLMDGLRSLVSGSGGDTAFVEAVPVALLKPVNGKAAQGMVLQIFEHCQACGGIGNAVQDSVQYFSGYYIPMGGGDTSFVNHLAVDSKNLLVLNELKDTVGISHSAIFNDTTNSMVKYYVTPDNAVAACKCCDTFAGKLASTVQGTTDTTFYILAVYFGSVGIKKIRYAMWAGLLADAAGIIAAIIIAYIFFT